MMRVRQLLVLIYGEVAGATAFGQLNEILEKHRSLIPTPRLRGISQRDAILIAYPDQIQDVENHSLAVLSNFCHNYLSGIITGIHILPFYPWSSDDGFSVIDYREVASSYGNWNDIKALDNRFRLMFDAVINHISVRSPWFQFMLQGEPQYRDYFIVPKEEDDLSRVVRPRAFPLLTPFQTSFGEQKIWTTFSADQVDLNYANPNVLLEIVDVLLFYISQGAEFIRLDAIAYLWKEVGTSCIHLPQTHWMIQLFRAVLDDIAPHVMLITETNVPHEDNISYFGDGTNEAQMVYNFSLPPLVLHAFQTGSAEVLSRWASNLELSSDKATFFNFLASHDGIGLNPLRGILSEAEIEAVVNGVQARGGLISFKSDPDGTPRPYELNINYFDALNDPNSNESVELKVERFLTVHAILLAIRGVPGIYFHSLFGSSGWREGVIQTGRNRTINREKTSRVPLENALANPDSLRARVFRGFSLLLKARASSPAFHPYGNQRVIDCGQPIFAILRFSPVGSECILCLHNVSGDSQRTEIDFENMFDSVSQEEKLTDLISGQRFNLCQKETLDLYPYQSMWLVKE